MGALVELFEQQIYRLCYRFLRNEDDSLDCTQETFLKAIAAFDSFQEGKPLSPWLRRIAANTCLNQIRQRSRTASLDDADDEYGSWEERLPAPENVPEDAETRILQSWVDEQMKDLPPAYRMALVLRHVEDMSYQDIADQMAVPIGTVKTYLFRGRNILKRRLAEYMRLEVAAR